MRKTYEVPETEITRFVIERNLAVSNLVSGNNLNDANVEVDPWDD